jgi:NADH-quinone oxidoreductase subunit L
MVAGMTAFYMFRQVFMVFFGECRADHHTQEHLHESPSSMTLPLWVLAAGSVLVGYLGLPHASLFEAWLEPVMVHHAAAGAEHAAEAMEYPLMALSVGVAVLGIFFAYLMYGRGVVKPESFANLLGGLPYRLSLNKFYVDELYQATVVNGTLAICYLAAWFDRTIIDGIVNGAATVVRGVSAIGGLFDRYVVDGAVNLVADATYAVGGRVRHLQTGAISAYLYVVIVGVLGGVLLYWSWAVAS